MHFRPYCWFAVIQCSGSVVVRCSWLHLHFSHTQQHTHTEAIVDSPYLYLCFFVIIFVSRRKMHFIRSAAFLLLNLFNKMHACIQPNEYLLYYCFTTTQCMYRNIELQLHYCSNHFNTVCVVYLPNYHDHFLMHFQHTHTHAHALLSALHWSFWVGKFTCLMHFNYPLLKCTLNAALSIEFRLVFMMRESWNVTN